MTDNTTAKAFAELPPEGFALIDGVDDDPSVWHVNEHFMFSTGSDAAEALLSQFVDSDDTDISFPDAETTHALVFQRGDASEEWLVVVVTMSDENDWAFEEQKLAGKRPDDYTDIEGDIEVLDHDQSKTQLGDDQTQNESS